MNNFSKRELNHYTKDEIKRFKSYANDIVQDMPNETLEEQSLDLYNCEWHGPSKKTCKNLIREARRGEHE